MLRLVSPRPHAQQPKGRKRAEPGDSRRLLYQKIDGDRAIADATQRAVATGRQAIVDARCCVQRAGVRTRRDASPPPVEYGRRLAELASRLDVVHQRLLLFSSSVELEMDRLDMLCCEVEQLTVEAHDAHDGERP